jgi:bifunctional UDP-N-acetylglucosamine pyrophosphorylase/glucosamine-1-phosphate N-acetyltransferase
MNIGIILAAGEGTRMKSKTPKVLHEVMGKKIIQYVLDACSEANINEKVMILGHGKEKIIETLKDKDFNWKEQPIGEDKPYGTGYAVMQAEDLIEDNATVVILNGDVPLIEGKTLDNFINFHKKNNNSASVLTAKLEDPYGYGRIIRKDDKILGIVEEKDASEEHKRINEINSGIYCFNGNELKEILKELDTDNSQQEYYITDGIKKIVEKGLKVGGYIIEDAIQIKGVNNRIQLSELSTEEKLRINKKHMLNGVTLIDPDNTYIEKDVEIGMDTTIYPNTFLEGKTIIGEDNIIGPGTIIQNSKIGNNNKIENSKIIKSTLENHNKIGPYAYIRPNCKIGSCVKVGDFVELKNTTIGDNSKASHLAYLGDGEVGENANIGCGVIFVNYDGKNKHKTIIKDGAFVGSNSNLVAPIVVDKGAYIACGSTITEDVEENALAIGRARQVIKINKGKDRYK